MTGIKRILLSGWEKFSRDRSSTGAALVVMVIVLFMTSSLFFLRGISSSILAQLEEAVDVSVYFSDAVPEEEILQAQDTVRGMPEVLEAAYVSKEDAYEKFVERHSRDEVILRSLEELGQNPLLPSLDIRAHRPDQYELIAERLEQSVFAPSIQEVDFHDRRAVIERVTVISEGIRWGAASVSIVLAVIAVLVAFNTIRLTIYASREEIEIMRLVGASNGHIRGPFLVQGAIVGIIAALLALALTAALALVLSPQLEIVLSGFSLWRFFLSSAPLLFGVQLLVGIGLGLASSVIAIGRYLRG